MNRLQKKCVIATTGVHLLLLVILFVGPAFLWSREKADDTQVLDLIPETLVDSATTGVQGAQPPPTPAPQTKLQPKVETPPPQPKPPESKPPEEPAPVPKPTLAERLEKYFKPEPAKPAAEPAETPPRTPKVNLTPVTRVVPKNSLAPARTKPDNSKAIDSALTALRKNLSSSTTIDLPGDNSVAAANYAQVVKSKYERAWTPPDNTDSDDANVKVRVTIASDGTVVSAEIITPSGDASVDRSVQNTLDRVQFIAPFPSGSTDRQRTYTINFNLKAKRLNG